MGPKRGRAGMGVASQTERGGDHGVTSRGIRTQQGSGHGNPTPVVLEAHSGAGMGETTPDVLVIPSQFVREVAAATPKMERTRHEEIRIQRDVTNAYFRETMNEFRKMNPPSFDSLGDPVVAGHWLSKIHKIFDTVRINEDDTKVSFASYQLVGKANEWWESVKDAKGVDLFEKLVQGDVTVSEYAIKFQSLSRFTPVLVNTKAKKRVKPKKGQRKEFDLLDCARRVKPKKGQRKEFKGNWELRQMSVGTSSTTSRSFNKKRPKDGT
ncbi:hypothetical protein Acr_25g0000140 [Actinidia rufa]|uniref:Retrotransposon gag domain-containing protein n=1 Tax=Actinidia rufa TaxID=165716 RepID=A0A7J0GXP4_9ERIC|nr:hypothetical protein Acr_25g0000140 [Actinidia rufa]